GEVLVARAEVILLPGRRCVAFAADAGLVNGLNLVRREDIGVKAELIHDGAAVVVPAAGWINLGADMEGFGGGIEVEGGRRAAVSHRRIRSIHVEDGIYIALAGGYRDVV